MSFLTLMRFEPIPVWKLNRSDEEVTVYNTSINSDSERRRDRQNMFKLSVDEKSGVRTAFASASLLHLPQS